MMIEKLSDQIAAAVAEKVAANPLFQSQPAPRVPFSLATSVGSFQAWLRGAHAGQHCIYHTGYHLHDVKELAAAVRLAKDSGLIALKQMKADINAGFHFMAERLRPKES